MRERIVRLLDEAGRMGADAALLHAPENVRYFTGFTGEGCALFYGLKKGEAVTGVVFTDSRYTEQARKQAPGVEVVGVVSDAYPAAVASLCGGAVKAVGFEDGFMTVAQCAAFSEALAGISLVPLADAGVRLRAAKDVEELGYLRRACEITDKLFEYALAYVRPGVTEMDIAEEMRHFLMKEHGAKPSFNFIVAAGENGSMPHAIPSERAVRAGDFVTLDFGAEWMGYKADMTRTFAVGRPSERMMEVYGIVQEAQRRGAEALRPGAACRAVDAAARDFIAQKGYGANFGHGLGHGVGLQIHERPNLKPVSEDILAPGMAVTVEPGIYIPGEGGVRIEDTCLITADGWESLFKSSKDLIIL
jgi:Xaa-Pro aminopeptidase